ncbi:tellurite resistance TerB family protein [Leeuwenhoekiella palythoae]|uniref:Tellurite resistance protein TerB n=1 Tax=Leeuwenhoekiella palythoae TaxID=573501 RepID=A0A1M5VH71_9FLAO|nr:TerB family tellurite resistance protein [Leeuwenhoekiella palythoae]MAS19133.1 TerB family tellurite resistance protein [Leeuwenhoekiella sp.]MEC7781857.1 TerB family tellurite resistance protein [Bacteroidota bacterium]MBH12627.1 TerB family tellurite resistance protein [Leeuwenhoekiella sp.]MEC8683908.1 TerB family tellurite resistance protein [Bacteroidota bacterium]MEC8883065.1 TerB family tellurite resistance protein [Bacteroidota bacterium]|tara:strand:- start:2846 stop:3271 length:426 start_codon:yes stop_codon:yes gene_type:complete
MSFTDLFDSGEHRRNLGHFAAIANMATVDGELNAEEIKLLKRFAVKLDIDETEYVDIVENARRYPINPPNNSEKRLERLHDLFRMIFVDHTIDDHERFLIEKYAIGLGFSAERAKQLIERSIQIFQGGIDFDDYLYLLDKK